MASYDRTKQCDDHKTNNATCAIATLLKIMICNTNEWLNKWNKTRMMKKPDEGWRGKTFVNLSQGQPLLWCTQSLCKYNHSTQYSIWDILAKVWIYNWVIWVIKLIVIIFFWYYCRRVNIFKKILLCVKLLGKANTSRFSNADLK